MTQQSTRTVRRLAVIAPALALCLGLAGCGGGEPKEQAQTPASAATPLAPGTAKTGAEQEVQATVGPPVAQPGPEPAPAAQAEAAVAVEVSPAEAGAEGRTVQLQSRAGEGDWTVLDSEALDADGTAVLTAPGDPDATLRVVAAEQGNFAAVASKDLRIPTADFSDEFDGDYSANWTHRSSDYNPAGLRKCSKGSEDAVEESDGVLALSVLDDPERDDLCTVKSGHGKSGHGKSGQGKSGSGKTGQGKAASEYDYRLNANIQSNAVLKYGTFAARIKFQQDPGQHGSFWLQSTQAAGSGSPEVAGAEIDIVEFFGQTEEKKLASFVHYYDEAGGKPQRAGNWIPDAASLLTDEDDDWWRNYHVFSLEWTPDEYIISVDGQEAWRTSDGISQIGQIMVLSLLSSDYELKKMTGDLPATMEVDWVRHWPSAAS